MFITKKKNANLRAHIIYIIISIPLFWWPETSSPDYPGSAEGTALYWTPGSHQIWACQSAWWLRSQPAGRGWAGSLPSQRALGFVLASRQTRSWPQLGGRGRKRGTYTQVAPHPDQAHTALIVGGHAGLKDGKGTAFIDKLEENRYVLSGLFDQQSVSWL